MAREPKKPLVALGESKEVVGHIEPIKAEDVHLDGPEVLEGDGTGEALPPIEDNAGEHEAEFEGGLEKLVGLALAAKFEGGTLKADIRDAMIQLYKDRPRPWSQMSNSEQRDVARALEAVADQFIRKTVLVVAEQEQPSIHAKMESYSAKEGFKIVLSAVDGAEHAALLYQMHGFEVIVLKADASRFTRSNRQADTQPDQPDLEFEGGGHPDDNSDLSDEDWEKPVRQQAAEDFAADSKAFEEEGGE